ncbi:hypothetical protein [Neptunomonas antarctica]|uniref:TrbL/VirB6 plasmid conjugal transfer protein n=2 Tax=Neptunomonas antarctica TaxID=619304 RepID=A0A1N7M9M0_9GAMM|nr:hypothetical protein [Neptunomonas antarctica]SIS82753.1 hypothetical protein SAMN05421760_105291 [Neptunomonas antarctica]
MQLNHSTRILITLAILLVIMTNWLPQIDLIAQRFLSDSISSNAIIFGVVRTLNGVISVIQSTDIGIGVASVSVGEILDPVNDLIERFSALLLATLTALGIAQVLLLFTLSLPVKIVFTAMAFACGLSLWLKPDYLPRLLKWTLLIIFIRFIFVLQVGVVWLFDWLYFDATGKAALSVLEATIGVVENLKESITSINLGELIFGSDIPVLKNEELGAQISSSVVTLIVGMLFKSIIIPVGTLWLGYKAVASAFIRNHHHA